MITRLCRTLFVLVALCSYCLAATYTVNQRGLAFNPNSLSIFAGDSVQFAFAQPGFHNVAQTRARGDNTSFVRVASTVPSPPGVGFRSLEAFPNILVTFTVPGFYYYICERHARSGMKGFIAVRATPRPTLGRTPRRVTLGRTPRTTPKLTAKVTQKITPRVSVRPTLSAKLTVKPTFTFVPASKPTSTPLRLSTSTAVSTPMIAAVVNQVGTTFRPATTEIRPGETVRFHFNNPAFHDLVQVSSATSDIPIQDSPNLDPSTGFFSPLGIADVYITFPDPGSYFYICTPHVGLGMRGVITVLDTDSSNLQPTPPSGQLRTTSSSESAPLGLIIGAAVGGVVGVALIVFAVTLIMVRYRKHSASSSSTRVMTVAISNYRPPGTTVAVAAPPPRQQGGVVVPPRRGGSPVPGLRTWGN